MITPEQVDNVLNYFYNNNDNRSTIIAKELNIKLHSVDYIIDLHLSKKRNYMGNPVIHKAKINHGNCKEIIAYDAKGNFIDSYNSIRECSESLHISKFTISKYLQARHSKTRNGYSFEYSQYYKLGNIVSIIISKKLV